MSWRTIRISAVSDPPPSLAGWMERTHLVRVAVNVEQLLSESPGGIGRYSRQLATLLSGVAPADEVVPLVARHPAATARAALAAAGIHAEPAIAPLPRPALYETWVRFGLPPVSWSRPRPDVDLVHAPSAAVPGRGRVPLVVTVHDAASELWPDAFSPRGRAFHRRGAAAAAERADAVITVSHAAADEIVAHTPIRAEQLRVVPHGVDAPAPDPVATSARLAALGLEPHGYLLWVGSLEPRKNVATLVAAAARLARAGRPPPPLVLAGYQGWRNAGMVDPADRATLGAGLVELGRVAEADLWALYGGAVALAVPSRHEGFGLPAVEAMSQGCPVICSDIPALVEVTAGAAITVPPSDVAGWADAVDGLLGDPATRAALAAAGRRRAGELTPERMVRATRAVYREVTGGDLHGRHRR